MKVVIAGGGTGGHLFPALIVAKEMRQLGHEVYYAGNENYLEKTHTEKEGFAFIHIPSRSTLKKDMKFVWENSKGVGKSLQWLRKIKPDVVFSTGGFTTAPLIMAAQILRIPFVLHEQNAKIGLVQRIFRKKATAFIHSYPYEQQKDELVAGNLSRYEQPLERIGHYITFMGGSGGAKFMNDLAVSYAKRQPDTEVLLLSGANYEIEDDIPNLKILSFVEDMESVYKISDMVIARSGSTTLAELSSLGIPSLVIPMPNSADDHQRKNAEYYVQKQAVLLIEQNESTLENLESLLKETSQKTKEQLSKKIKKCYNRKAKTLIVDAIQKARHQKS